MFQGSMVALITPMHTDGSLDLKSLRNLVEWHIEAKTDAIVVAGTTGESATLSADEQNKIITSVIKYAAGRIPVIAGTGTNATDTTIKRTQAAEKAGVDGCLVVTPYYNKPTQNGLYAHYKEIAASASIPLILYNVPSRTGCDLLPVTIAHLSVIKNIVGVKEATGKIERGAAILKLVNKDFALFSGDDAVAADLMLLGAKGVISVTANIVPEKMHALCKAALSGDKELTEKLNAELMPLHTKLFVESNPIPTKWALNQMGLIPEGIRLPLQPLDEQYHQELIDILHQTGALQSI